MKATYIKISGNKQKTISDFIEKQKKYYFFNVDKFTGIRTFHYKTDDLLKTQIQELVKYLEDKKIDFRLTNTCVSVDAEWVDIYYSSENN